MELWWNYNLHLQNYDGIITYIYRIMMELYITIITYINGIIIIFMEL